ncbi:hypothetical protein [Celerinatantimonas yamalensis]|uniref:Uncharacterized protein n=1 Tax=Celerinatantimonas yamalensis TaxID=559956 RepID=A0ABW9G2T2_9GAMM
MVNPIPRHDHADKPDSFEQLYRQGLLYLQQLSGHIWTDYNLHDPGVTILEQVCYALTDLIYRSDFAVSDYLAQPDGHIHYTQQGLALPNTILTSPPQQIADYEQYLLNKIPALEGVSLLPVTQPLYQGVYTIQCRLNMIHRQRALNEPQTIANITEQIQKVYHQVRGLGEDISQVTIVGTTGLSLCANVQISGEVEPNRLIAQLYWQATEWIDHHAPIANLAGLFETLLAIPGIINVQQLQLIPYPSQSDNNDALTQLPENAWLAIPLNATEIQLQLSQHGHPLSIDFTEILYHYHQQSSSTQSTPSPSADLTTNISGHFYDLSQYESIQTLFPRNYRLAAAGISHYQPQQQAQRHQLRSYLLLFDQLMANFCADLAGIRQLWSTLLENPVSYQVQPLGNHQFRGIEQHYASQPEHMLRQLQSQFDNYPERKGRIFDYLLALYGEHYPDALHYQFNDYFSAEELEWKLLHSKQQFILHISALTANRGLGCDLCQADSIGDYQRRLTLLLGISWRRHHLYSRNITQYLLNVVPDSSFARSSIGQQTLFQLPDVLQAQLEDVPAKTQTAELSDQQIRQMRSAIVAFKGQTIPESLLQYGITSQNYRILPRTHKGDYQLFFTFSSNTQSPQWLYIGCHRQRQKLMQFSYYLRQWLIQLNRDSEGLYVIEHIALRPTASDPKHHDDDNPYAQQISIVLPGFTARHQNPLFRSQAESLITQNTPAHLMVHYHWLSFYAFCAFETLYTDWREARAKHQRDHKHCDQLANELLAFLLQPNVQSLGLTR